MPIAKKRSSVVVGTGNWRFEQVVGWGRLPDELTFGKVSSVAVDREDRVYVYQRGDPPVVVFGPNGDFLAGWGSDYVTDAHSIFASPDGSVYLADRDGHSVLRFRSDGTPLQQLGSREPKNEEPFNHPADMAVSPTTGDIFVCDGYANSRIHRFTPTGDLVSSWGASGSAPGQFRVPHGIWVDRRDRVYVADRENNRIQVFTADGDFLQEWTDFYRPTDIYVDDQDCVYVCDHIPRMTILDTDGGILSRLRTREVGHGVWGDSQGNIYVASTIGRWIEKYVRL
jgi:DNA-binding beta-propeller fold protein YncE